MGRPALEGHPAKLPHGHFWDGVIDQPLPGLVISTSGSRLGHPLRYPLSNFFAFGCDNASLMVWTR